MKPKAVETKEISQAQWDFSQCPEAELSFCVAYEYLRQVALAHRQRMGKKWSPLAFAEVFKGYFQNGKRYEFKGLVDGLNNPFEINLAVKQAYGLAASVCSGFPDSPYNDPQTGEWRPSHHFAEIGNGDGEAQDQTRRHFSRPVLNLTSGNF